MLGRSEFTKVESALASKTLGRATLVVLSPCLRNGNELFRAVPSSSEHDSSTRRQGESLADV